MATIELKPVRESTSDYDLIEKKIKDLFKTHIYYPLLREVNRPRRTLLNADDYSAIWDAIRKGHITFNKGQFSGKFGAATSKELKELGATWDRKTESWRIKYDELPIQVKNMVSASNLQFEKKLSSLDKRLSEIVPEQFAKQLSVSDAFDKSIWKVEKNFEANAKKLGIQPKLTREESKRIADEWQNNMHLWIQDFTKEHISELRAKVKESVYSGNRYGALIDTIQDSYDVSANKAKFLARQETSILMAKHKQVRYESVGSKEYKWKCVTGTPAHPVRPYHKKNDNKIFRWDSPPTVNEQGERKHAGVDYNCRCFSIPIVTFTEE